MSKAIKIKDSIINQLDLIKGKSYSDKIEYLLILSNHKAVIEKVFIKLDSIEKSISNLKVTSNKGFAPFSE